MATWTKLLSALGYYQKLCMRLRMIKEGIITLHILTRCKGSRERWGWPLSPVHMLLWDYT